MIKKTKNEILEELYKTEFVQKYISQLANNLDMAVIDDLRSEIWVQICSIKEEKITTLYQKGGINKIRQYCGGLIYREMKSKTSPCYKYKKHYLTTIAIDDFGSFNGENLEEEYDDE